MGTQPPVIGECLGDCFCPLFTIWPFLEHPGTQPCSDELLREGDGILALLKESRSVLLEDWDPDGKIGTVRKALTLGSFELGQDCLSRY